MSDLIDQFKEIIIVSAETMMTAFLSDENSNARLKQFIISGERKILVTIGLQQLGED